MKSLPWRAASIAGTENGSKRVFRIAASVRDSFGATSLFQTLLVSSLVAARISRTCLGKASHGSSSPGMATRAAMRSSKAAARAVRFPAMLSPARATLARLTSDLASSQSTTGVTTCSQLGVKGTRFTKSS